MLNGVIIPQKGRYILAVSGGVDSITLLDILAKQKTLELIVAHYNHNMRAGSDKDEEFTSGLVGQYGLKFETDYSAPGLLKSEDDARKARYDSFEKLRSKHKARAIITAHHQDDLIETALINLLRGTGRKGLSAISSNPKVIRPLINVSKKEVRLYANRQKLKWIEDPTNVQNDYLRNYVRNNILVKLRAQGRQKLINNLQNVAKINNEIDKHIATISRDIINNNVVDRVKFANLPLKLENELLAYWFRENNYRIFSKKILNLASTTIKTAKSGTLLPISNKLELVLTKSSAALRVTDEDA